MPRRKQHHMSHSREYRSWSSMRSRCHNPNAPQYKWYGGRGITVCERWNSFPNFFEDMGPRPPNTSIDRIHNDKGYFPENCRWADQKTQLRDHVRGGKQFTVNGMDLREICAEAGADFERAYRRLRAGHPLEVALYHGLLYPWPWPETKPPKIGSRHGFGANSRRKTPCN